MRAAVSLTALVHGGMYLVDSTNTTLRAWIVGLPAIVFGMCLLIGFLTPAAGAVVGAGSATLALSGFPAPTPNLLEDPLAVFLVVIMAVAIVLLGPGRWSVDAYLFGRREIIIPHGSHSPEA